MAEYLAYTQRVVLVTKIISRDGHRS